MLMETEILNLIKQQKAWDQGEIKDFYDYSKKWWNFFKE